MFVAAAALPAAGQTEAPSRALLDRYCVTCHNERLQTAGVMFDQVDIGDVAAHRELFEKVAKKLLSGQMPPQGRPRPEPAAVEAFLTALEAELDRVADAAPNPGRVASHRLNRTEYVNAVRDLLALEIDGEALLPSDMAGFGFDNNAEVLAMTPALMDRYITAATKVSRLAVGTLENRPAIQVYRIPTGTRQEARMGEDLPFATHGGLAARHAFSLDGDYLFRIRLQRSDVGETIFGNIAEREYHLELRIDHALVARLSVGGEFAGQVEYTLTGGGIAPPDDDIVHQRIALYNQTADNDLLVRLPVRAGTRLVSVAFTDVAPSASRGEGDNVVAGIATLEIHGPFLGRVPEETPSRGRIFVCQPATPQDEEPCAREIVRALASRAYRRPVTDADLAPLMAIYEIGRAAGDFETGVARALEALLSMPAFLMRAESDPIDAAAGTAYRISDLELASRLSFFLWRSIPDDELLEVAASGRLREPAVLARADAAHARGSPRDALDERLPGPVAADSQPRHDGAGPVAVPRLRRHAPRGDGSRDRAVLREPGARRPQRARPPARRLHLPERQAGRPLRHPRRVRQPLPPHPGPGRLAAGAAGARQRPHGDLLRRPHVGRAQGQVGARDAARLAAAAAARERAAAAGERRAEQADVAARADGAAPFEPRLRELPREPRSAGLRARELRRHRPLARGRRGRGNRFRDHLAGHAHREPGSLSERRCWSRARTSSCAPSSRS